MPNGAAKDSAMLYYYMGLRQGDTVMVSKSDKPEYNAMKDSITPLYLTSTIESDGNNGYQVRRGDTLIILGGHSHSVIEGKKFMAKDRIYDVVMVRAIKNGKPTQSGWFDASHISPLRHNWAMVFYEPVDVMGLSLIFSGAILLIFLIWKFFYWLIQNKIRDKECFYNNGKIYFKSIYLLLSALVGVFIFYIDYNETLVNSLKFSPNFFANFSEYPLFLKLFPLLILLWAGSAIGMFCEMVKKLRSLWLIIYFPGIWAFGFFCASLIFIGGWLIYFVLPTLVTFAIMALVSNSSAANLIAGSGGSKKQVIGYDATGQEIREGDAGRAIAHHGPTHPNHK
ncbi:hypothetical protein LJB92_02740 [Bacteroidales bacterium OttesenSCG-928-M06]|nr:hypothetical protein [Bacteroidales bacterium OttesenSCG-928-M06]